MQPFTVYWFFIFVLLFATGPTNHIGPTCHAYHKIDPTHQKFQNLPNNYYNLDPLVRFHLTGIQYTIIISNMQIANEIRPKQHGIGLLQMLQYTRHNMLVFVDMLHSFELGFGLHLCKKQEWTYKNKNVYRTSNSSQWGIQ